MDMRSLLNLVDDMSQQDDEGLVELHDSFDIELNESFVIETGVIGFTEDGIILEGDDKILELLEVNDIILEAVELDERMVMGVSSDASSAGSKVQGESEEITEFKGVNDKERKQAFTMQANQLRQKGFVRAAHDTEKIAKDLYKPNSTKQVAKEDDMDEAKYQGREVQLGKPMAGDVKKSKVYVRGPKGNVVKVNFGDKKMKIKKSNPKRRKSFRARRRCENPGPRWKARYWSCRAW